MKLLGGKFGNKFAHFLYIKIIAQTMLVLLGASVRCWCYFAGKVVCTRR